MTTPQKGRIFISYRRVDSEGYAGRIYDRLAPHFGADAIFMDVDAIPAGMDFVEVLEDAVNSCDLLIALIGRQWLNLKDEHGKRRLDYPEDFVRIEIAAALKRGIRVIPVLLGGTQMPSDDELPDNLKELARRNALDINHNTFKADTHRLLDELQQALWLAERERKKEVKRKADEEKARKKALKRNEQEQRMMMLGKLLSASKSWLLIALVIFSLWMITQRFYFIELGKTYPEYVLGMIVWLFSGVFFDSLKILFSTVRIIFTSITNSIISILNTGRTTLLEYDVKFIELNIIKDVARVFGVIKCSMITWSNNLLSQVVKPEEEEGKDNFTSAKEEVIGPSEFKETYPTSCKNNDDFVFKNPKNKYAGQQIIGALIGFLALLAFLYADAAEFAQTFSVLFDGKIPPFLSIITPLTVASVGSVAILFIFIGDIYGFTNFGLFHKNPPVGFKRLIIVNLILSLSISNILTLARMELLGIGILVITTQSIAILPMLITTFLLFRGIPGVFVAVAIVLVFLSVPSALIEISIYIWGDLLRFGVIAAGFMLTRLLGIMVGGVELIFFLLELAIKGSLSVLVYLVVVVFLIPNLLFRIVLRISNTEIFYDEFLENILPNDIGEGSDGGQ